MFFAHIKVILKVNSWSGQIIEKFLSTSIPIKKKKKHRRTVTFKAVRIFLNVSHAKWVELGPCSGVSFIGVIGGNRSIATNMWGDFIEDGIGRGALQCLNPLNKRPICLVRHSILKIWTRIKIVDVLCICWWDKKYLFNNQMCINYCIELYINSFVSLKNDHLKPMIPLVHWEIFR